MTKNETMSIVDSHYPVPTLKHWKPSDYEMNYKYNTPRKTKKLEAVREKEDAKLRAAYDQEVVCREDVVKTIDEVSTLPPEVADLFLSTFKWTIEDLVRRHEAFLAAKSAITNEFGDNGLNVLQSAKCRMSSRVYKPSMTGFRGSYVEQRRILTNDEWSKFADECKTNFHKVAEDKYDYDYPAKSIKDPEKLMMLGLEFWNAQEADEVYSDGDQAYVSSIQRMAGTLKRIMDEIKDSFNGEKPDACETGAGWGAKGNFEGVLRRGSERVSFKSFGAGGYNIQRFHFRFKVTKLKH